MRDATGANMGRRQGDGRDVEIFCPRLYFFLDIII